MSSIIGIVNQRPCDGHVCLWPNPGWSNVHQHWEDRSGQVWCRHVVLDKQVACSRPYPTRSVQVKMGFTRGVRVQETKAHVTRRWRCEAEKLLLQSRARGGAAQAIVIFRGLHTRQSLQQGSQPLLCSAVAMYKFRFNHKSSICLLFKTHRFKSGLQFNQA